jgi:hypothetical protein
VTVGALLAVHYAQHFRFTVGVVGASGIWGERGAARGTWLAPLVAAAPRLGTVGLQSWFALGCVLGAAIALGRAPRLSAALLLVVGAITFRAVAPAATLDDWFAQVAPFWLVLFSADPGPRSSGGAEASCVVFLMAFFLRLGLEPAALPAPACFAFFAAAACALAPLGAWRVLAFLPAIVGLGYVAQRDGATLACGLALATGGLAVARAFERAPATGAPRPLGIEAAIGASVIALFVLHDAAEKLGATAASRSTSTVLSDLGLEPYPMADAALADTNLDVAFAADGGDGAAAVNPEFDNPRLRLLLRRLEGPAPEGDRDARVALIKGLVSRQCRAAPGGDAALPGRMDLMQDGRTVRPLAWFRCSANGAPPVVVPMNPI